MVRRGSVLACAFWLGLTHTPPGVSAPQPAAPDYLEEANLFGGIPIVTAATRRRQKITATPTAITIVDRETITASAATEIPQLFNLVPRWFVGVKIDLP